MRILLFCLAFMIAGCKSTRAPKDLQPPQVIGLSPTAFVVPIDAAFNVAFSEAMAKEFLQEKYIELSRVIEQEGKSSRAQKILFRLEIAADNQSLSIIPTEKLPPNSKFSLEFSEQLRDVQGNPIIGASGLNEKFSYFFMSDESVIELVDHDFFSAQSPLVALNRRVFSFQLSSKIDLEQDTLQLISSAVVPEIDFVWQDKAKKRVYFIVKKATQKCEIWQADSEYTLHIKTNKKNLTLSFKTGAACDNAALFSTSRTWAIAAENSARLALTANLTGTLRIWFGTDSNALDCLGQKCPLIIEQSGQLESSEVTHFVHTLEIDGLKRKQKYHYQMLLEDSLLRRHFDAGVFETQDMPHIILNEVMQNPLVVAGASEATGEYIELVNLDEESYVLDGYKLLISKEENDHKNFCTLAEGIVIKPKQHLVLVGEAFVAANYPQLSAANIVRMPTKTICGTLTNSTALHFRLHDDKERLVSAFDAPILAKQEGRSIERQLLKNTQKNSRYCLSRRDMGPSPGALNSIMVKGCEE